MHRHLIVLAVALLPAGFAAAQDLPLRRAGLWELKTTTDGPNAPPQIIQQCIDAATDKQMNQIGGAMRQDMCSKQEVRRSGSTITVDTVCQVGPSTRSRGVITGDFNSAYTVKMTSTREGGPAVPGMPAAGTTSMTIDAKWLGACKTDQKPGDMIMADGRKMNIGELQRLQQQMQGMQGPPGGTRPPGAPAQKK